MNANSIFAPDPRLVLARNRTYELLAEAAAERYRAQAVSNRGPGRLAAAARALRQAISTTADSSTSILPRLEGYPYRS